MNSFIWESKLELDTYIGRMWNCETSSFLIIRMQFFFYSLSTMQWTHKYPHCNEIIVGLVSPNAKEKKNLHIIMTTTFPFFTNMKMKQYSWSNQGCVFATQSWVPQHFEWGPKDQTFTVLYDAHLCFKARTSILISPIQRLLQHHRNPH